MDRTIKVAVQEGNWLDPAGSRTYQVSQRLTSSTFYIRHDNTTARSLPHSIGEPNTDAEKELVDTLFSIGHGTPEKPRVINLVHAENGTLRLGKFDAADWDRWEPEIIKLIAAFLDWEDGTYRVEQADSQDAQKISYLPYDTTG